jgi:hypothetical protein
MQKIYIKCTTDYPGMTAHHFFEVPEDTTHAELDNFAYSLAIDNAESYGIYPLSEEGADDCEYSDEYSDSIAGHWELYVPEKHDRYRVGSEITWNQY